MKNKRASMQLGKEEHISEYMKLDKNTTDICSKIKIIHKTVINMIRIQTIYNHYTIMVV